MPSGPRETIYGRNAAYEVIRAGRRRVHRLPLADGGGPRGRPEGAGEAGGGGGASAGACGHRWIAAASRAQSVGRLKEAGVWVVGLELGRGAQPVETARLGG